MNTLVEIQNLNKIYTKGTLDFTSFKDGLFKKQKKNSEFKAIKDLNLKVFSNDIVGLIGKNGSGKSTLLKIISRITTPSSGRILVRGTVASLLEVGVGFHPELTGEENIYLSGSIFGYSKKKMDIILDDIVEFADLKQFIDTPVKKYSSGMLVKLGFSITTHLEPTIFIVDEVLAVGDSNFREKAVEKIKSFSKMGNKSVFFVSHNDELLKKVCNRGVLIENGELIFQGTIEDTLKEYQKIK